MITSVNELSVEVIVIGTGIRQAGWRYKLVRMETDRYFAYVIYKKI